MMNSPCQNCFQNINPKYIEPNGFIGNSNYNFKRFCEELYLTLYKDREGFEDTALLLRELYLRTNIDGAEVARRNGFGSFELLLKHKMFSHVVGFEKIGDQYSYRYYARLSKEFEHIRRTVIPKERTEKQTPNKKKLVLFNLFNRKMDQLLDVESLKKLTPEQKNQVISGIKQQAAIENAQQLITALSEKCTTKCITSPGSSLSGSEKQCLQRCMDRFIESWNLVSVTLQKRLQHESAHASSSVPSPLFDGVGSSSADSSSFSRLENSFS